MSLIHLSSIIFELILITTHSILSSWLFSIQACMTFIYTRFQLWLDQSTYSLTQFFLETFLEKNCIHFLPSLGAFEFIAMPSAI